MAEVEVGIVEEEEKEEEGLRNLWGVETDPGPEPGPRFHLYGVEGVRVTFSLLALFF